MGLPEVVLDVLAVLAAFIALAISSALWVRQNKLGHRANQLPIVVELFTEMRSYDFLRKEEQLWRELPAIDPAIPISDLPAPLREYANDVGNFYSMIAYLWMLQAVDERLAIWVVHHRAPKTWDALLPFVKEERAKRGSEHSFFNVLEIFVAAIRGADITRYVQELRRRTAK